MLRTLFHKWQNETPDSERAKELFEKMIQNFPTPEGMDMPPEKKASYFMEHYFIDYVFPYVKEVQRQAFYAAYKDAFAFCLELLGSKEIY